MPTGPVIVAEQLPNDYPTKKIALDFRSTFQKVNNAPTTDAFSAYSFDGYMVFADAAARAEGRARHAGSSAPRCATRSSAPRKWSARMASTTSSRATCTASTSARA